MNDPAEGDIWRYPYLWGAQDDHGETEGRKNRPTAVVAALRDDKGLTHLFLLPLTTKKPRPRQNAVAIPALEARRAGLSETDPIWVMLDEYNYDIQQKSAYFDPDGKVGRLSAAFMKKLLAAYAVALARQQTRRVDRRDI